MANNAPINNSIDGSLHTANVVFTFIDVQSKNKFIEFLNGKNGLCITRSSKGCHSIECYENEDDPLSINIWQMWHSKEDQEMYLKFRQDDGTFAFLHELLVGEVDISYLKPLKNLNLSKDDATVGSLKMAQTFMWIFTLKNAECKDKFFEFLDSESGLRVTRAYEGCQSVECYEKVDKPLTIVFWDKWNSRDDLENYFKYLHKIGTFSLFKEWTLAEPEVLKLNPLKGCFATG